MIRSFVLVPLLFLLLLLPVTAAPGAADGRLHFRGTIGDKLAVLAELTCRGETVVGSYRYLSQGRTIMLEGSCHGERQVRLVETVHDGERRTRTGTWEGGFDAGRTRFSGTWKSVDGRRSLPFRLELIAVGADRARKISGRIEAEAAWPEFRGYSAPVNARLSTALRTYALTNLEAFGADYDEMEEGRPEPILWMQSYNYEVRLASPRLVSVFYRNSVYSGGAHPNRWTRSFQFAIAGETVRPLTLQDFLLPGQGPALLSWCRSALAAKGASMAGELGLDALATFSLLPSGVHFHFDPYVAGCYAEGDYELTMPLTTARRFFRSGLLD